MQRHNRHSSNTRSAFFASIYPSASTTSSSSYIIIIIILREPIRATKTHSPVALPPAATESKTTHNCCWLLIGAKRSWRVELGVQVSAIKALTKYHLFPRIIPACAVEIYEWKMCTLTPPTRFTEAHKYMAVLLPPRLEPCSSTHDHPFHDFHCTLCPTRSTAMLC